MKPDRDIYIVSLPRVARRVQAGPLSRTPFSSWRNLSREDLRRHILRLIADSPQGRGVKVFTEPRRGYWRGPTSRRRWLRVRR